MSDSIKRFRIKEAIRMAMLTAQPEKMSAETLASLLGVNHQRARNIMAGRISYTEELLDSLRRVFNKPATWPDIGLIPPLEISDPSIPVSHSTLTMPHAGNIPAGQWQDPQEAEIFCEVEARLFKTNRFCAEIVGESCYPALQPGDFTIWEANKSPKFNKIIIAERYPDHAATVKVLIWDSNLKRPALHAINPAYQESLSDHWDAVAFLVHLSYKDDDGGEITFYREDGIRPEQLIKYRGEKLTST